MLRSVACCVCLQCLLVVPVCFSAFCSCCFDALLLMQSYVGLLLRIASYVPGTRYILGISSFFFLSFSHILLASFWTSRGHRCRPFSPPVLAFIFYRAWGSAAIPLLVDFSSSVANSRSRVFRKSICAQAKVPTILHAYELGRIRTHETDLYQARG